VAAGVLLCAGRGYSPQSCVERLEACSVDEGVSTIRVVIPKGREET
jgi:hypothetical protein